jgi:hypothetical protein
VEGQPAETVAGQVTLTLRIKDGELALESLYEAVAEGLEVTKFQVLDACE